MATTEVAAIPRDTARISVLGKRRWRDRLLSVAVQTLRARNLLWRVNFTVRGTLRGTPVAIPLLFGNGVQNLDLPEPWFVDALDRVLGLRQGTFVDVGVNLGQTLLKVKALDAGRRYVGFEPSPVCASYAQALIAANRFTHATIVPAGLATEASVVQLFSKAAADPSASMVAGFRDPGRYSASQSVVVLGADSVFAALRIDDVAVVKVDVEGAELDVLQGMQTTLRRFAPFVFCEILPVFDETTDVGRFRRVRETQLLALMRELGYRLFRLLPDGKVEPVETIEVHGDLRRTNYIFVPAGDVPQFATRFATR